jgi:hypothetical protein
VPDLPGQHNALYRIGVMLLNGYGYNWYRRDNQIRADDLLVRSRASELLETAAAHLRELEGRYRRKYLRPPSREHPDPDLQRLAAARQLRAVQDRILAVDTSLRGASVPPADKVWLRHRREFDTLQRLAECDALLVAGAKELATLVTELPAEVDLDPALEQQIDSHLDQLRLTLAQRAAILVGEDRDP